MKGTTDIVIDEAHAWIDARLAELGLHPIGPVEEVRVRPWALVLAVQTTRGRVFFKANEPAFRHEGALVAFLAGRHPDLVPAPLALDMDTGWMLMADAGVQLRQLVEQERDVSRWLEVLPQYAALQADLAGDADALVALGVPDLRLALLPARFEAMVADLARLDDGSWASDLARLREQAGRVASMAGALAGFGIPETIEHDDLHDGAVHVAADGRYRIIDWGDACVAHPFFSLSVTLEGVIAWGADDVLGSVDVIAFRDAYLAAYAERLGAAQDELRAACTLALRLGWVCRAVNVHEPGADAAATWRRLRLAFDGHP